ncbi:MAG: hypothetical protein IPL79_15250 [Myxococcales bacterium]|nr:hypothetical protein [Myxococcales bacterium]
MLNKQTLLSSLFALFFAACIHGQTESNQPALGRPEGGEPCGDVVCAEGEQCELLPLACPPNEVCAEVMEERCVAQGSGDEEGSGGGGDDDASEAGDDEGDCDGGGDDDGDSDGAGEPCLTDADCSGGICYATEAPLVTLCQDFHNGACACGPILFP